MAWAYVPEFFKPFEFECRCGCGAVGVSSALLLRLDAARRAYGRSIYVTSGRRCEDHNSSPAVGGSAQSRHLIGCAVDVRPPHGEPLQELAALLALFFSAPADEFIVYPAKGFIHVAVSRALARPQWTGGPVEYR